MLARPAPALLPPSPRGAQAGRGPQDAGAAIAPAERHPSGAGFDFGKLPLFPPTVADGDATRSALLQALPEEGRGTHPWRLPALDSEGQPLLEPAAPPEPAVDPAQVDEVRPGDRVQQRRALLGGMNAAEVWELETDFQTRLAQAAKTEEETARLRARFLVWCESVLFREGPGAVALLQLGSEEDALIKAQRKAPPESLRLDVYRLRARRAQELAPVWAALKERFLEQASAPPPEREPGLGHLVEREPGNHPGPRAQRLPPVDAEARLYQREEEEIDASVLGVVRPNDRAQQTLALVGAMTAAEVFDLDPEFAAQVRNMAVMYADLEAEKAMGSAATEATRRVREEQERAPGTPGTPEELEQLDMAAEAAMEQVHEDTTEKRFAELRGKFVKWGGRVIFQRSVGKAALNRLAAEERALVKREKKSTALQSQVVALRRRHAEAFRPKLADIKARFLQGASERILFWFNKQPGVTANEKMVRPADTAEGATKIKDLGGIITADNPELEVADSVVAFARALKAQSSASIGISTYATHSWGRYSLDLFPGVAMDPARGLYDANAMVDVFLAIDAAARATGMKWRALYNDYEVARRVHAALGSRKIGFQWEHGPAPYVLHIHLDLSPRALDAPAGSGGSP